MSVLDSLLDSVKQTITGHVEQGGHQNFDTGGLLGKITDLFGAHARNNPGSPLPASRDPYGDPGAGGAGGAGGGRGNVKPASQDPYGDPADQGRK